MLQIMNLRFEGYQHGSAEFPHELGIFLGYPLADVKGFIEHNGKDFLYQGYWKVYENVEERKKMFSIYNVVKEEFIREMQALLFLPVYVSVSTDIDPRVPAPPEARRTAKMPDIPAGFLLSEEFPLQ